MIFLYKTDSASVTENSSLEELLNNLPKKMHERAYRYKFSRDAFNYAVGRHLLKKGLEDMGKIHLLDEIRFHENGKPFLEDVHFNISHSDNLVVCAFSTQGPVGVDVEKEKALVLDDFKPWFSKKEWEDISSAENPLHRFNWYWTRKESIIKAMGVTLSQLHMIEIDASQNYFFDKGKKWYLKDLELDKSMFGAICSAHQLNELKQIEINTL